MSKRNSKKSTSKEQLAYNCLTQSRLRRSISPAIVTIDESMKGKRPQAYAVVRELSDNFPLIDWSVNVNADFTSSFAFSSKSGNADFDKTVELWMSEKSLKNNLDASGRLSLAQMIRMFRILTLWDGDAAILKLEHGQLQLLESWQIAKGEGAPDIVGNDGLVKDDFSNRTAQFSLCGKVGGKVTFKRLEPAENVIYDGYFPRPNCSRGISKLLGAVDLANALSDTTRYYIEQARIASMLGIALYRGDNNGALKGNDFDKSGSAKPKIKIEPLMLLDMSPGEKAEFLKNDNPSMSYQEFSKVIVRQILSTLGIPYSAYDSLGSTYAAMRADWTRYGSATAPDRAKMSAILDEITLHLLRCAILDGELQLPAGMMLENLNWEWVPQTQFVLDKSSEIYALQTMVKMGILSRQRVAKMLNCGDLWDVFTELEQEETTIKEKGLTIELGTPGATTSQSIQSTPQPSADEEDTGTTETQDKDKE
jgi:hypothetical protein